MSQNHRTAESDSCGDAPSPPVPGPHTTVEPLPLFVFGTLRKGQVNHHYLAGAYRRMTPAVLRGYGKRHPLMIAPRDGASVTGELYEIRPEIWEPTIRGCDDLEGIAPGAEAGTEYRRLRVTVSTPHGDVAAWAYVQAD